MLPDLIQDHMNLGLRITAGTCGRSSLIVNDCGIWGLPQSRPWLNDQSRVRIMPTAPAAFARSMRATIESLSPAQ